MAVTLKLLESKLTEPSRRPDPAVGKRYSATGIGCTLALLVSSGATGNVGVPDEVTGDLTEEAGPDCGHGWAGPLSVSEAARISDEG